MRWIRLEIFQTSLKVTVLGMGIVFVALIGLVLLINALHKVTSRAEKKDESGVKDENITSEQNIELAGGAVQQSSMEVEPEELVAVITAAVAASLRHYSTHDIVVRSIRRVPAITPVWNRTSRQEQISSRL
ncbi:MAG: OadG family protein [Clostridiales bacterium]|nr:OadG family protein [Clostridiales bacterium]